MSLYVPTFANRKSVNVHVGMLGITFCNSFKQFSRASCLLVHALQISVCEIQF